MGINFNSGRPSNNLGGQGGIQQGGIQQGGIQQGGIQQGGIQQGGIQQGGIQQGGIQQGGIQQGGGQQGGFPGGAPNNGFGAAPAPQASPGGGLVLTKGQKLDLTKGNAGLDFLKIGLGWDTNTLQGQSYDLDAEVFLLGQTNTVPSSSHIVFYNNMVSPDGSIRYKGDNRDGQGSGDDESVEIQLSRVSLDIQKIVFTVTIDEAIRKNQNFGQVSNAYIRIVNQANGSEICRFDLSEDYSTSISILAGEVYRHGNEWKFNAIGTGLTLDLAGICAHYGAM
jgi:stress response protein SCP2